jgi:two-component system, NarL family, response regulator DesR
VASVIRVLIAEDQGMVRGALKALLAMEGDIEIVAETDRADRVVPLAVETNPEVALLDIEMPGGDGITAAGQLRQALPACKVLILTTFGRPGFLRRAMESGAAGFMLKDAPSHELAVAIRRTMKGERVVDPGLAAAALSAGISPLSDREREVLKAGQGGVSIAEIARSLFLSEGTVRNYLSSAIQKLEVSNRTEAARVAEEQGWL